MAGNTEITLTIADDFGPQDGEPAFEADRVDYRITCGGSAPGSAPIPPDGTGGIYDYDDSVDISGAFEIIDGDDPPVWQTITDLPPGDCTASLSVYRDGAVVCLGSHDFTVLEDENTSLSITLLCELSIGLPGADGDAEGEFQVDVGNECPKLFNLSAHPPVVPADGTFTTLISAVAEDLDGTCGSRCDPQVCDDANPPNCMPGPDIGLVQQLSAFVGSFDDPSASLATYTCDPSFPGPIEICFDVTDGDIDCDKSQCIRVICPDLCDGVTCDDSNDCTYDYCEPSTGLCVYDPDPDGVACMAPGSTDMCDNTCVGGACIGGPFTAAQNAMTMPFTGLTQTVNQVYVNPYTGFTHSVSGPVFHNISTYKGVSSFDTITGTNAGDFLLLSDPTVAPQTVCGVEQFLAGNFGDFAHFADLYITTVDMLYYGQNSGDILWGNAGDDFLDGGTGNDVLDGGPGNDIIFGGTGNDEITMAYDNGVDSIFGGTGAGNNDRFTVNALASQIGIGPPANPTYEFDVYYLGTKIAEITEIEFFHTLDSTIDLGAECTAGVCDLCGNDVLNWPEECDDGNLVNGDGCADDCTVE